jgi:hypothetical protein
MLYRKIKSSHIQTSKLHGIILLILFLFYINNIIISASDNEISEFETLNNKEIHLYYFYFVPRCDECIILEKALNDILAEDYQDAIKRGDLVFNLINLSDPDPSSEAIIKKLRVRRQLLLLVKNDNTINLTRDAFRFVERDYERFSTTIKKAIDQALSQ